MKKKTKKSVFFTTTATGIFHVFFLDAAVLARFFAGRFVVGFFAFFADDASILTSVLRDQGQRRSARSKDDVVTDLFVVRGFIQRLDGLGGT